MNIKELAKSNNVGNRIKWVRLTLEIAARRVARENSIPWHRYRYRELNYRTECYEEFQVLSYYFDKKWQNLYRSKSNYPKFENTLIEEITPAWLMFGLDKNSKAKRFYIEHLKKTFEDKFKQCEKRELELVEQKFALEMQLQKAGNL